MASPVDMPMVQSGYRPAFAPLQSPRHETTKRPEGARLLQAAPGNDRSRERQPSSPGDKRNSATPQRGGASASAPDEARETARNHATGLAAAWLLAAVLVGLIVILEPVLRHHLESGPSSAAVNVVPTTRFRAITGWLHSGSAAPSDTGAIVPDRYDADP